ncbi:MAG: ABC transporter ATP-binding protein [Candidatus Glassbacteria bacterium]
MNEIDLKIRDPEREGSLSQKKVILETIALHKYYKSGDTLLRVLRGIDFVLYQGEVVSVVGPSGSGKSTFLHLLGGIDRPTKGEVLIGSLDLNSLGEEELSSLRNKKIGFIFQFHHLLRDFTALENVMMPLLIGGHPRREVKDKASRILESLGLVDRKDHRPIELSGGEQQRVAVARALVNSPVMILADEPTGNLDRKTGEELHDMIFRFSEDNGVSFVIVTHNEELARKANRIFRLVDGTLHPEAN